MFSITVSIVSKVETLSGLIFTGSNLIYIKRLSCARLTPRGIVGGVRANAGVFVN